MAKMRRVIESGDHLAPSIKRQSILKNATNLPPSKQAGGELIKPPTTKRGPRKKAAGGSGEDHSTPNQLGGGIQTKIPQYLKENVAFIEGRKEGKGPSAGAKDKLNDRWEDAILSMLLQ